MKKVYGLEKFAFVDENGLIYTAKGLRSNISDYDFDYKTIKGPEISVEGLDSDNKTVIIAIPVKDISLNGKNMKVCFEEIEMKNLVEGLSLQSDTNEMTFCNIYTTEGVSLTNMVLGGLASEDNLLEALEKANYTGDYSFKKVEKDFKKNKAGVVSFEYNGIQETLDYVPVEGTDWMLTYLVRESVISDKVGDISRGITMRSLLLTLATILALFAVFGLMVSQMRKSAKLEAEREAYEAESRVKQEEMENRLALQEELLEQEKQRTQQDRMITAMSADYRSVYYVDLDEDDCICYRTDKNNYNKYKQGDHFPYLETFTKYGEEVVDEKYRERFLEFIQPDSIKKALETDQILVCRYLKNVDGKEGYEMRGIEVEHAENGRVAVEMFETNPAGYYDAILMDIRMPEMDGLTATSTIRSLDRGDAKTIPIIALTANAFDEDVQLSLQAGLNAHLSKPVEPENLFATLESLIKD